MSQKVLKYILHSPIQNQTLLPPFVERCISESASIIAIVGQGSRNLEDKIDYLIVDDGSDNTRFIVTTSHEDESLSDVRHFLKSWEPDKQDEIIEIRI